MGPALGITAALTLIFAIGFGCGLVDLVVPESAAPEVSDSSSPESPVAALSFPIPYSATVTQSGDGIAEPRTRFYVAKSVKEAK
jgi:hypothetical protein